MTWLTQWRNLTSLWRRIAELIGRIQISLKQDIKPKYLNPKVFGKFKKFANTKIIFNNSGDVMMMSFITKSGADYRLLTK